MYSRDALLVAFRELVSPISDDDYERELQRQMEMVAVRERLSKSSKTESPGIFAVTLGRAGRAGGSS